MQSLKPLGTTDFLPGSASLILIEVHFGGWFDVLLSIALGLFRPPHKTFVHIKPRTHNKKTDRLRSIRP